MAFSIYKPGQGRYARGGMGILLLLLDAYGCSALRGQLRDITYVPTIGGQQFPLSVIIPTVVGLLVAAGVGLALNYSKFADFLIETEVEMGRVIWPTRKSVIGSSVVVIVTTVAMSALLYGVDSLLYWLLTLVKIY